MVVVLLCHGPVVLDLVVNCLVKELVQFRCRDKTVLILIILLHELGRVVVINEVLEHLVLVDFLVHIEVLFIAYFEE